MANGSNGKFGGTGLILWVVLAVAMAVTLLLSQHTAPESRPLEVSYTRFLSMVEGGEVASVTFRGDAVEGTLHGTADLPTGKTTKRFTTRMPPVDDDTLVATLRQHDVEVTAEAPADGATPWLLSLLPWLLIIGVWYFLWRRMAGNLPGGGLGGVLQGKIRKVQQETAPKVRFADVAGQENAKAEVAELLEFLRNPERYRKMGAEVPRGILLEGPPGTGKTLLARALAGEAGVAFFPISASEFIEVFVGVGASRVRQLFEEAKKNAPSIIFIDELDSVGRMRGTGYGGGNDEREQTLNQILAELDGFEGHEATVVLAATNRPDVLDPALLRPVHVPDDLKGMTIRMLPSDMHSRTF